jgi:hypothetical protein
MGIIYKTTNQLNGKWYIGKDEKNNPKYLGSGVLLAQAIKKYGKEHFKKEVIAECNDGRNALADLEKKIIAETNAVSDKMAYNIAEGGIGGHTWDYPPRTKEHCDNISKALTGKKLSSRSADTKNKISIGKRLTNTRYKIVIVATGEEIITDCLSEFSKKYNIAGKTLRYSAKENKIVKGKFLAYKMESNNGNS